MATTTLRVIGEDHICGYQLSDLSADAAFAAWVRGEACPSPYFCGSVTVDMAESDAPSGSVVHLKIDDLGIDGPFKVTSAEPDQYRQGIVHLGVKSANLS